jgi:branched-chain amino acid transport system permease protein
MLSGTSKQGADYNYFFEPSVLGALWLLFNRTRWGTLVRAATLDREMVGALGVNQRLLFTSVFFLGSCLAGLGGALQLPRESVNLHMDLAIIAEAFVVVVVGGLGSVTGAFLAAVLIGVVHAFGILIFPKITLVLVFLVMAVVLIVRPYGLMGRKEAAAHAGARRARAAAVAPGAIRRCWARRRSPRWCSRPGARQLWREPADRAGDPHAVCGEPAFHHGARRAGLVRPRRLLRPRRLRGGAGGEMARRADAGWAGGGAAAGGARRRAVRLVLRAAVGRVSRHADPGVRADRLVDGVPVGGPDGRRQRHPGRGRRRGRRATTTWRWRWRCGRALALREIIFSPFGYALRAGRDSPVRAEAIGLNVTRINWAAFAIAAVAAGIAGGLYAYFKGSVFPTYMAIPKSVDALLMVLLGGVQTVSGPIVGGFAFSGLQERLVRAISEYWRFVLGAAIVLLVLAFPRGPGRRLSSWRERRGGDEPWQGGGAMSGPKPGAGAGGRGTPRRSAA